MNEKTANDKIIKIEECINILMSREKSGLESVNYKILDDIETNVSVEELDKIKTIMRNMCYREDLDFVNTRLLERGYVRKNGTVNYTLFQNEADITQSVWSRYQTSVQNRTDHDTLLKIILGLRLNEKDARYYLSLTGSGFAVATDMVDRIVLSYIMLNYLEDENTVDIVNTVMFLLDYYSKQEVKAGRKPLRLLYKL